MKQILMLAVVLGLAGCSSFSKEIAQRAPAAVVTAAPPSDRAASPVPPIPRIFTEAPLVSSNPLAQAFLTNPAFFQGWSYAAPLDDQIQTAVMYLKTVPPGYRGACFGGWFFYPLTNIQFSDTFPGLPKADPLKDFQQGFISNTEWETARFTKIARAFAAAGIKLDFAYFDFEGSWSVWGSPPHEVMQQIVADPQARSHFPTALLNATPGGQIPAFGSANWRPYIVAMSAYCQSMATKAMKKVLTDSGMNLQSAMFVNFYFSRVGSFTMYDYNGWPWAYNGTIDAAGTSCPVTYLYGGIHRYPPPTLTKDPLWNALIDDINHVRSTAAKGPTVPVIQTCDWTAEREWATEILLAHCFRTGITMFDLFNPRGCQEHDEEGRLSAIVAKHYRATSPTRLVLPEIPLDADAITTNGYTTKYADFISVINVFRTTAAQAPRSVPRVFGPPHK